MPRKRRKPRTRRGDLDFDQEMDLVLSRSPLGDPRPRVFENAIERKAAWYAHRDYLIETGFGAGPGRRPGAWWAYECTKSLRDQEERPNREEDWEVLLALGEMDREETAAVLGNWVKGLYLSEGVLRVAYDEMKQGETPMHGRLTWDQHRDKWERQAKVLGLQAEREWHNMERKIREDWEKVKA